MAATTKLPHRVTVALPEQWNLQGMLTSSPLKKVEICTVTSIVFVRRGLFKSGVSSSYYVVSNDRMIDE
jgi:hypothetical protein